MDFSYSNVDLSQKIKNFDLDPQKGIVNIGSDPSNDIVLTGETIRPFHLMLDYRQKPFRIMPLDPQAEIFVDGARLSGQNSQEIPDLNRVSFGGYTFLVQDSGNGAGISNLSLIHTAGLPAAYTAHSAFTQPPTVPGQQTAPTGSPPFAESAPEELPAAEMAFRADDYILLELGEVHNSISVEQTAVYPLTIVNGGPIVASFEVSVSGVPEEWVKILPDRVNLNEGARAGVEIHITPPRASTSRAGTYPLAIKVVSSNYHGHAGILPSELILAPYYEFSIGNLTPRTSSASWRKRSAQISYPIQNTGNSPANYLVSAQDEENRLQFEFQMDKNTSLVRQAEVQIEAGETLQMPIQVSPLKRSLVRLRGRQHQYSVSTQSLDESTSIRTISGAFTSRPLFGLFSILLFVILLAVGAYFLLRPHINSFTLSDDVIEAGDAAYISWKVSPFTTDLRIEGLNEEISGSQNQVEVTPSDTVNTYTLVAGNALSRMLRMEDIRSERRTLLVIPPSPVITTFFVDQTEIFEGDTITVKWSVRNADEVYLTVDGVQNALSEEEFNGEMPFTLRNDSLVILEAKNSSGTTIQSEFIHAQKPTIKIDEFTLSKTTITEGESVTIRWKVSGVGVENVQIAPFEEVYPLQGELTFFPEASMEFVLTVKNRDLEEIRLLPVGVLPPGADPEAPSIEIFEVAPAELVGSGSVEFSWVISGVTTNIELTNQDGVVLGSMDAQGFTSVDVGATTSYILTAYNGDLSSAKIKEVTVNETKKDVQVEVTNIIPSTAVKRGESVLVYASVDALKNGVVVEPIDEDWPEISGTIVVTDGFDTCEITLPQKSCQLTFNTSEDSKTIVGTYGGDDNYVRRTSDPYALGYSVVGEAVTYDSVTLTPSSTAVGQQITIDYVLSPTDPSVTEKVSGKLRVLDDSGSEEVIYCENSLIPSSADTSASGSCIVVFEKAGQHTLTLKYLGNDVFQGKTTSSPLITITKANTTITPDTSIAYSTTKVGESFTVSAFIQSQSSTQIIPTGKMVVQDSLYASDSCEAVLSEDNPGAVSCLITLTQPGTRVLNFNYAGDVNLNASPQVQVSHVVQKANTTTTITDMTAANGTVVGQALLVKVNVDIVSPGTGQFTGGSVEISLSSTETCTATIDLHGQGQCGITLLRDGYRTVTAEFLGTTRFNGSTDTDGLTVVSAETNTSITSHVPSPSAVNTPVVFTVGVETSIYSTVSPTGVVQVQDLGSGQICTVNYPTATTCSIIFTSEGSRQMRAIFLPGSGFRASTSATITHTVRKGSLTTIIAHTPNPSLVDQQVMVQVAVTSITGGSVLPSGTITVLASTGENANCSLNASAIAVCTLTFTAEGVRTLTATYNGDTNFASSTSVPASHTVNKITPVVTIAGGYTNPTTVGTPTSFTFTVSASSGTPDGSVEIEANSGETCSGTLTSGTGSCSIVFTSGGSKTLTAHYDGGAGDRYNPSDSGAYSITVGATATTLTITSVSPASTVVGETFTVGFQVTTATGLHPSSGTVTVSTGGSTLCTGNLGSAGTGSCSGAIASVGTGTYTLTATYAGSTSFQSSSDTESHTVTKADVTVNVDSVSDTTTVAGEEVTIQASVSVDSPGSGTPAGNLVLTVSEDTTFGNADDVDVTQALSGGAATFTYAFPEIGTYRWVISYAGSSNYNSDETSSASQTVSRGNVTISNITPAIPYTNSIDTSITFSARVNITAPASGTLDGQVRFTLLAGGSRPNRYCDDTTLTNYDGYAVAQCSIVASVRGDLSLQVAFSSDSNFNDRSTSTTTSYEISGIDTTTEITSTGITPASPSTFGTAVTVPFTVTPDSEPQNLDDTETVTVTASKSGASDIVVTEEVGVGEAVINFTEAGVWNLVARFNGGERHEISTSISVQHTVLYPTTVSFAEAYLDPVDVLFGSRTVYFTALVESAQGIPEGVVVVLAEKASTTSKTCNLTLTDDGTGRCGISFDLADAGDWTITLQYQGTSDMWKASETDGSDTMEVGN